MNTLELNTMMALVRREQQLLNVASELFSEHLRTVVSHGGIEACGLCRLYYSNDERASVTVIELKPT